MLQFQTIFIFTPFSIKPNQRLNDMRYRLYCLYGYETQWGRNGVGEYFRTTWWGENSSECVFTSEWKKLPEE